MPYKVVKKGNSYVIVNKNTGKTVAGNKTKLSKNEALQAMKARYANEGGNNA